MNTKNPDGRTGDALKLTFIQAAVLAAVRDTPKTGRQLCAELLPDWSECDDTDIWIVLGQLNSVGLVRSVDDSLCRQVWLPTPAGMAILESA